MRLLEEYSELIERDAAEISLLWKVLQILAYFLSFISGYSCAILFYILWHDVFGDNCPLWAKLNLSARLTGDVDERLFHEHAVEMKSNYTDWRQYVIVNYVYGNHCEFYFTTCFLSCIFGAVWLTLFLMCGRGGYDVRMQVTITKYNIESVFSFTTPWRVVLPALLFNFCLTTITLYATSDMKKGYAKFSADLMLLFMKISKRHAPKLQSRECVILQDYVSLYTLHEHDVCKIFHALEIMSWIMVWSWITGFAILLVRFVTVNDFRLLRVRIFEIPQDATIHVFQAQSQNEAGKEKGE